MAYPGLLTLALEWPNHQSTYLLGPEFIQLGWLHDG